MTLIAITREEYARDLKLLAEDDALMWSGVAALLRAPLVRWGLTSRRAVLRYAREQLEVAGLSERVSAEELRELLRALVELGECEEVSLSGEPHIAPGALRWLKTSDGEGALLGLTPLPEQLHLIDDLPPRDIVRRVGIGEDDEGEANLAALQLAGAREITLREWAQPRGYARSAARLARTPLRDDALTLADYWTLLTERLLEDGLQLSDEASLRALTGTPGGFFGRYASAAPEGRWAATAPEGVWCAYVQGYGEAHWHPIILSVDGERRSALHLYDHDEWRWAVLARGASTGEEEVLCFEDGVLRLTFPAPVQLRRALQLLGHSEDGWAWRLRSGAERVWPELVRELLGRV